MSIVEILQSFKLAALVAMLCNVSSFESLSIQRKDAVLIFFSSKSSLKFIEDRNRRA